MDIRQYPQWGNYLASIGWTIERIGKTQIFIRCLPLIKCSLIKIQHPQNPLPFAKINQIAKRYRALFVLIEPEIIGYQEQIFTKNGYQKSHMSLTHTATITLDLTLSLNQLFKTFSENARRNIKKAQKNELKLLSVSLKDANHEHYFRQFFVLLNNLTKLKKFHVPGFDEFNKKMVALKKQSILLFALNPKDKEPVAAVWLGYFDSTMYYMHTGITPEGYKTAANYFLVWEALKLAQKLHLKTFNFEGIYDPRFPSVRRSWKGLTEFKKRFHGTLIGYPHPWIKFYNQIFKWFYLCGKILGQ